MSTVDRKHIHFHHVCLEYINVLRFFCQLSQDCSIKRFLITVSKKFPKKSSHFRTVWNNSGSRWRCSQHYNIGTELVRVIEVRNQKIRNEYLGTGSHRIQVPVSSLGGRVVAGFKNVIVKECDQNIGKQRSFFQHSYEILAWIQPGCTTQAYPS